MLWVLDHGSHIALWGGRRPDQMDLVPEIMGWRLDQGAMDAIDAILRETIKDPVGPEFMAPPPPAGLKVIPAHLRWPKKRRIRKWPYGPAWLAQAKLAPAEKKPDNGAMVGHRKDKKRPALADL